MSISGSWKIKWQITDLFLLVALLFFLLSFLSGNAALDITLHDGYYVFPHFYVAQWIAVLYLVGWVFYRLLGRIMLSKILSNIHVVLSVLTAVCWIYFEMYGPLFGVPRRYYSFSTFNSASAADIWFFAILLFITPIIFLVNIIGGVVKILIYKNRTDQTS